VVALEVFFQNVHMLHKIEHVTTSIKVYNHGTLVRSFVVPSKKHCHNFGESNDWHKMPTSTRTCSMNVQKSEITVKPPKTVVTNIMFP
jgi:hypothetical protein